MPPMFGTSHIYDHKRHPSHPLHCTQAHPAWDLPLAAYDSYILCRLLQAKFLNPYFYDLVMLL